MARAATKKPAARRKGASRNPAPTARKGVPAPLWVVLGLLMGAFVVFLWHLWDLRQAGVARPAATASAGKDLPRAAGSDTPADAPASPAEAEPRFEFYTLLPNQEVMPGSKPAPAQPDARPGNAGPAFLLQAGSFRSEAEADKRRASILLLGMPVKVVKIGAAGGPVWYRVVVGPFQGKAAADNARSSLKGSGVDSLVIKQG